jgi:hypothetical protein
VHAECQHTPKKIACLHFLSFGHSSSRCPADLGKYWRFDHRLYLALVNTEPHKAVDVAVNVAGTKVKAAGGKLSIKSGASQPVSAVAGAERRGTCGPVALHEGYQGLRMVAFRQRLQALREQRIGWIA